MSHSVLFTELGPADFRPAISQFVAVYSAAMNPPDRMLAGRDSILERHAANPGFRALAAVADPGTPAGTREIAGFTYGFHGEHGQWWHDMVAGALALSSGPLASGPLASGPLASGALGSGSPAMELSGEARATDWLTDSFEVAELHVMPAYQGSGIGRSLLRRLLDGRPERTALLSTADAESKARRLYRGVGFTDLLTNFRFSGGEPAYAVMGARLPLRAERPQRLAPPQRPDTAAASPPDPDSPRPSIS